jgi:hypothetical protein
LSNLLFNVTLVVCVVKPRLVGLVHEICIVMVEQGCRTCFGDSLRRLKVCLGVPPSITRIQLRVIFDQLNGAGYRDSHCSGG